MIFKLKNKALAACIMAVGAFAFAPQAHAQFDLSRAIQGVKKAVQAHQITDEQMAEYVHQSVEQMDKENQVAPANSDYSVRLANLTKGLTQVEGIPLNFKVYITKDVNAFACADGSVRVYSGLMDLMTDDEVLGVIGHEIGHVAHHDSKNALKKALQTSAFKDVLASSSGKVARLTDSQLGSIGETLVNNKYSRTQEDAADAYGYEFLKANGKNPWAMAMAFEKLQTLEGQGNSQAGSMLAKLFSDHPDTAKRIANITKRCEADGIARPTATTTTSKSSVSKKSGTTKKASSTKKTTTKKTTTKKSSKK